MGNDRTKKRKLVADGAANLTQSILAAGSVLSERYAIVREVGRGGMGIVYEAKDRVLDDKVVAIKVLPPELANSKAATKRLKKEAIASMELHHENIVRLYSFDVDGAYAYIVLEFLDGEPLDERLADVERFSYDEACAVLESAAAGLTAAHESGVIHRDIKPANLMYKMTSGKRVLRITDFGIAFVVKDSMTRLTGVDSAGTLSYVAPEILKGELANEKTDQYSLAVTMYELMAGDPPFFGAGLSHQILNAKPRAITDVPDCVNSALQKALSKEPNDRFESLNKFAEAFKGKLPAGAREKSEVKEESGQQAEASSSEAMIKSLETPSESSRTNYVLGFLCLFFLLFAISSQTSRPTGQPNPTKATTQAFHREVKRNTNGGDSVKLAIDTALQLEKQGKINEGFESLAELTRKHDDGRAWSALIGFCSRHDKVFKWRSKNEYPTDADLEWFHKAAEKGIPAAQFELGYCYSNGVAVGKKDEKQAFKWFQKAAEQGHPLGQNWLAIQYDYGYGVKEDNAEASKWYKKAAEQGVANSQYWLGYNYEHADGVPKSLEQAFKWYKKAAENNNPDGQEALGRCYEFGLGTEKNEREAFRWYKQATGSGREYAQYRLGMAYKEGKGIEKNLTESVKWFRKAAAQGLKEAEFALAVAYDFGYGVDKNGKEAVKWYTSAAKQGHRSAQYNLAHCYEDGTVAKNREEAIKWFRKASEQGHEKAKKRLAELLKK